MNVLGGCFLILLPVRGAMAFLHLLYFLNLSVSLSGFSSSQALPTLIPCGPAFLFLLASSTLQDFPCQPWVAHSSIWHYCFTTAPCAVLIVLSFRIRYRIGLKMFGHSTVQHLHSFLYMAILKWSKAVGILSIFSPVHFSPFLHWLNISFFVLCSEGFSILGSVTNPSWFSCFRQSGLLAFAIFLVPFFCKLYLMPMSWFTSAVLRRFNSLA